MKKLQYARGTLEQLVYQEPTAMNKLLSDHCLMLWLTS